MSAEAGSKGWRVVSNKRHYHLYDWLDVEKLLVSLKVRKNVTSIRVIDFANQHTVNTWSR